MDDEELHYWADLWTKPEREFSDDTWFDYHIHLRITGELIQRSIPKPPPRERPAFDIQKARKRLADLRITIDGMTK